MGRGERTDHERWAEERSPTSAAAYPAECYASSVGPTVMSAWLTPLPMKAARGARRNFSSVTGVGRMPEGRSACAPTDRAGSHMKNQCDCPASCRTQQAEPLRVPPYAEEPRHAPPLRMAIRRCPADRPGPVRWHRRAGCAPWCDRSPEGSGSSATSNSRRKKITRRNRELEMVEKKFFVNFQL